MASRHAMKYAANERRYGWLMERGALSRADDARARALAEAVHCPVCDRLVHPTNMKRHNELYHTPPPSPIPIGLERGSDTPLLCAVNPGSPLAVPVGEPKVIQMPMPGVVVNKAKVSLIAMTITALVDAALDGNYDALDEAMADIQHELYRAAGADEALRGEYKQDIRKELYSSETLEALEGVA